jgi:hypothetical protein
MAQQTTQLKWSLRSTLPGRVRLVCPDLIESPLLRHHCAITLTHCHWIKSFRINIINGSLVLVYPQHRHKDLDQLLENSLTIPGVEDQHLLALAKLRDHHWRPSPASTRATRHGLNFGSLLLAEVILPIPAIVMIGGTFLALLPLAEEIWHHWKHKHQLPPEALELAFSGILLGQGHAGETLLDLILGDSTDAIAGMTAGESELHAKPREFFDHISRAISLEMADEEKTTRLLKDVRLGDRYHANVHSHVFLPSIVAEGEIIVINRLFDGDWRPQRIGPKDTVYPGALIIKGHAILEARKELKDHTYYIQAINTERPEPHRLKAEERLDKINQALTPLLLGAGAVMCGLGAAEKAIGLLQFTPINSWKSTKTSSRLTAISSLSLQGVHINNADALIALGKARHVVISRSCLDRIGGIKVREHIHPESTLKKGDLLRILAGIQNYLLETDEIRIWSDQLNAIPNPAKVEDINIGNLLCEGWQVSMEDGRQLTIHEQEQPPTHVPQTHLDPLEIKENGKVLGHIELITNPSKSWIGVCETLEQLGVQVHIVGRDSYSRMLEIVRPLGIRHETHLHGSFDPSDRLELVRNLQREGEGVIYMGYLLCDMPALTVADVSINIDINVDSAVAGSICDVDLGTDAHWLPRVIQLSRRIEKTEQSNFTMIAGSSLLTGIAATAAWIAPLPTVLLANIPIILAELRNIYAMNSHGVFELEEKHTRALPTTRTDTLSCRLPKARATQPKATDSKDQRTTVSRTTQSRVQHASPASSAPRPRRSA